MISDWTAPTSRGTWLRVGAGVTLLAVAVLLDRRPRAPIQVGQLRNPLAGSNNPIDRLAFREPDRAAANLADAGLFGGPALPVFLALHPRPRPHYPRILLATFEAALLNFAVTSLIKNLANRPRPYVTSPGFPADAYLSRKDRAAFLSGHASMATTGAVLFASIVNHLFEDKRAKNLAWYLAGFAAGATSYLRVKAAKHWPTDAIAGMMLGSAIARLVFLIHAQTMGLESTELVDPGNKDLLHKLVVK